VEFAQEGKQEQQNYDKVNTRFYIIVKIPVKDYKT
jgi:hypothetical protein